LSTNLPSGVPSSSLSDSPSSFLSSTPSIFPSLTLSGLPSFLPSVLPSSLPSVSHSSSPSSFPTTVICEDDQDFGFSYTDSETNVIVESCAGLSDVDAGTKFNACKEKFPYPDDDGDKTKLKEICHLSCDNCRYHCEDENTFKFEYTIEGTGVSVGTCSELAQLDEEDQDEVCGEKFMFPDDETGEMKKLKKICISTCRNCPLVKPSTPLPSSIPSQIPSLKICADDDDFRFDYTDTETGKKVKKCEKLSRQEQDLKDRACDEKFNYPGEEDGRSRLRDICILTCDNCPLSCEDDAEFSFVSTDVTTGDSIENCSELSGKKAGVIDEVCEEEYMYSVDSVEDLTKLKDICTSTCRNCLLLV